MPTGTDFDVKFGFYDHASFWVEYFTTGTIGTTVPAPQLCAVVNFPEIEEGSVSSGFWPIPSAGYGVP